MGLGRVLDGTENLIPLGFDPRTVRPIASRYTDCTITAAKLDEMSYNCVIAGLTWAICGAGTVFCS